MPRCITLVLILGFLSFYGYAIADEDLDPIEQFVNNTGLLIRNSLSNKNFANDPASILWTLPKEGENSIAVDIGIAFRLVESSNNVTSPWIFLPKLEYLKNTQTDKSQDTFKAGFVYIKLFNADAPFTHYVEASIDYKNDRKQVGQGASASLSYTPTYALLHLGYTGFGPFQFMITPWLSIQAEQAEGLKASDPSGTVLRLKPSLKLAIYPLHDYFKKNLEVLFSYQLWINFSRSGSFKEYSSTQDLFYSAINIYFDNKQRFGIGISYLSGENPEEGLERQSVISISLKVKLGK